MFKDIFIFLAKDSKTPLQNYKILVKNTRQMNFILFKSVHLFGNDKLYA